MPKRKGAHLDYEDRCAIEDMVKEGLSLRAIARRIGVSPSTVAAEIERGKVVKWAKRTMFARSRRCARYEGCTVASLCEECRSQALVCKHCRVAECYALCPDFDRKRCPRLEESPHVCNACARRYVCDGVMEVYDARAAQIKHDSLMRSSHAGVSCGARDLARMVSKVSSLLDRGQSLEAIWASHADEFPVGVRTFYNYMNQGVMGLANIQLPKKVRYRPRKRSGTRLPKVDVGARTYADWRALTDEERMMGVQMDTVMGRRQSGKCILTLHFTRLFFQAYVLLERRTQECVVGALDRLEAILGERFGDVFPAILADRGSEFLCYEAIERSALGEGRRTRVFYCDPMKPSQKGACERNHEHLRRILPKGTDFSALTEADVALACSHVNSYPRAAQGGAPIDMASLALPEELLEGLGIAKVAPDDVVMRPRLLEQRKG